MQNEIVAVWLPQGAGGGGDSAGIFLLTSPVVFLELAEFTPSHCALIEGLNGGSLGRSDWPGLEPRCCRKAFHTRKVLYLLPASVSLSLYKACDNPH